MISIASPLYSPSIDIRLGNYCVNCLIYSSFSVSLITASFVQEMGCKIDTRCS